MEYNSKTIANAPENYLGALVLSESSNVMLGKRYNQQDYLELFNWMMLRTSCLEDPNGKPLIAKSWIRFSDYEDYIALNIKEEVDEEVVSNFLDNAQPGVTPYDIMVNHSSFGDQLTKLEERIVKEQKCLLFDIDHDTNSDILDVNINAEDDSTVYNGENTMYYIKDNILNCSVLVSDISNEEQYILIHNLRSILIARIANKLGLKKGNIFVLIGAFDKSEFNNQDIITYDYDNFI